MKRDSRGYRDRLKTMNTINLSPRNLYSFREYSTKERYAVSFVWINVSYITDFSVAYVW